MVELAAQRRLAAKVLKCGASRVWIDPANIGDVAEAITTEDIRRLIREGTIKALPKKPGISAARRAFILAQKRRGHRKGRGSRKGALGSRLSRKQAWISRIRSQRKLLKELLAAGRIDKPTYKQFYARASGGAFRSRAHLLALIESSKDRRAAPQAPQASPPTQPEGKPPEG